MHVAEMVTDKGTVWVWVFKGHKYGLDIEIDFKGINDKIGKEVVFVVSGDHCTG